MLSAGARVVQQQELEQARSLFQEALGIKADFQAVWAALRAIIQRLGISSRAQDNFYRAMALNSNYVLDIFISG